MMILLTRGDVAEWASMLLNTADIITVTKDSDGGTLVTYRQGDMVVIQPVDESINTIEARLSIAGELAGSS